MIFVVKIKSIFFGIGLSHLSKILLAVQNLTGLAVFKAVFGQVFIEFHRIAAVKTRLAEIVFRVLDAG